MRELENVVERAVALAEGDLIGPDDLPSQVRERRSADVLAGALARGLTLAELEREYIKRVLQAEGGNKTRAAQRLGLDRKTLYRKLEEYGRAPGEPGGAARAVRRARHRRARRPRARRAAAQRVDDADPAHRSRQRIRRLRRLIRLRRR